MNSKLQSETMKQNGSAQLFQNNSNWKSRQSGTSVSDDKIQTEFCLQNENTQASVPESQLFVLISDASLI